MLLAKFKYLTVCAARDPIVPYDIIKGVHYLEICHKSRCRRTQTPVNSYSTVLETFQIESCIRAHHIYKEIWNPSRKELTCSHEIENTTFAVAVKHRTTIVGHVPCKISAAFALLMAKKGTISCKITGSHHFSADLP